MSKITSRGFAQMLTEAGVITADEAGQIRRIVINVQVDSEPMIYVERYADSDALARLAPMLRDIIPDALTRADE